MNPDSPSRKIILAVSGASGAIYANRLLGKLLSLNPRPAEIAVIFSATAREIWEYELGQIPVIESPAREYSNESFYAPFASGSSGFDTMIVCPASMGTLGRIANGTSDDLIARAADVMMKERRRLILVPREAPYNLIHIRNMETLTLAGAVICPASPSFYSKPRDIESLADTIAGRVLSLAGFNVKGYRWMEND